MDNVKRLELNRRVLEMLIERMAKAGWQATHIDGYRIEDKDSTASVAEEIRQYDGGDIRFETVVDGRAVTHAVRWDAYGTGYECIADWCYDRLERDNFNFTLEDLTREISRKPEYSPESCR